MTDGTAPAIAICTHNRPRDVRACLSSLLPQIGHGAIPVVVVDSASDASAAARLSAMADEFGVSYLRLDDPGLSRARNAAARFVQAEWIAFLDDDATVREGWLKGVLQALADAEPSVGIIGGTIHPAWTDGMDHAPVTTRWKLLLSCVEGQSSGPVGQGRNICGANFVIRKQAWDEAQGFPEQLGRVGTRLISGEESWLIERLVELGWQVLYDDRFAVDHHIPAQRLTLEWARQRAYWEGVSRVRIVRLLGRGRPFSLNPVKLAVSLPVLYLLAAVRGRPDDWIRAAMARGSLRGIFG